MPESHWGPGQTQHLLAGRQIVPPGGGHGSLQGWAVQQVCDLVLRHLRIPRNPPLLSHSEVLKKIAKIIKGRACAMRPMMTF